MPPLSTKNPGTIFTRNRRHRFTLHRELPGQRGRCVFICLNPSTADATTDDPTVRRIKRYATEWNFSELYVLNIFSLRSTDPAALYRARTPNHPDNDKWIDRVCQHADLVVCAWGTHGSLLDRDQDVYGILRFCGGTYSLRDTKDGFPSHPLYLPANLRPVPHRPRRAGLDVRPVQPMDCSW